MSKFKISRKYRLVPFLIGLFFLQMMGLAFIDVQNKGIESNVDLNAKNAGTLDRNLYPITLSQINAPSIWTELDNRHIDNMRIAYFDGTEWILVPFQLDEKGYVRTIKYEIGFQADLSGSFIPSVDEVDLSNFGRYYAIKRYLGKDLDAQPGYTYKEITKFQCENEFWDSINAEDWSHSGGGPPTAPTQESGDLPQNPHCIDYDDELFFYTYNGDQVSASNWWNSGEFPYRYEIAINDPIDSGQAWMYLYYNFDDTIPVNTDHHFIPSNGPNAGIDYVNWDISTLTATGLNYVKSYDANNVDLSSMSVNSLPISEEIEKQFISMGLHAALTQTIELFDTTGHNEIWREGSWLGTTYSEVRSYIGYGLTMDLDLAGAVGVIPGQDTNYRNGHDYNGYFNQPHGSVSDGEKSAGIAGKVIDADSGDHDGDTSEDVPYARGVYDDSGVNGEAAIDGPCRVIINQYKVQVAGLDVGDPLNWEELYLIENKESWFTANKMGDFETQISLDMSFDTGMDLTVEAFVHFAYIAGQKFRPEFRSDSESYVMFGQAPQGESGLPTLPKCYDGSGKSWPLVCFPDGSQGSDEYTIGGGPLLNHYNNNPINPSNDVNPLSDWAYMHSSSGGALMYIPYQETATMFTDNGFTSAYWADGATTEFSVYGNNANTNGETQPYERMISFGDFDGGSDSNTDINCKREYARMKMPLSNYLTFTYQEPEIPTDTTPPSWTNSPVSETIELGGGISQDVEATDPSVPIVYSISGTDADEFNINSGTGLLTNSEPLTLGTYDIDVTATDSATNALTTSITINVVDTTDPTWNPTPVDQTVELGTTLSYNVNADDLSAITYSISDTTSFAIDSSTGVITSGVLALGDYALTITATDAEGNYITATITVHVVDTANPVWDPTPVDQTVELGTTLSYDVNADDSSTITYSISDTTNFAIDSSSGMITSGVLALGDYALTITATDADENSITASITIHVVDTTDPVWNPTPVDQTVELGTTLSYNVNANDLSTITYSLSGTTNFAIDSSTGVITSEILALGDYALTITATDAEGNYITATITVHVVDTANPVWDPTPVDQTVELGTTLSYDVNADDSSTITYSISDTTNFAIDSSSGVITSGVLALGDYDLTITATDADDNSITASITIHVVDTTDPVWNPAPVDQTVELGTTLSYDVNADDLSAIIYSISDTTNFAIDSSSGVITSGVLALGDYALTITGTDAEGNYITTTITVHVVDTTDPEWNPAPVDQTVELGTTLSYDTNADDSSTITYSISDTTNFAIDLSTGVITSEILALGDYALTITATDAEGNYITATITVHVVDTTNPVWNPAPVDQSVELGTTLSYDVNADDLSTITYSISDTTNFAIDSSTGVISSGVLALGDYALTITATDAEGNYITATITVHVVDTTNPVWDPTPVDKTVELGTTLSYDVNADDSSTITYSISDTTNFAIDSSSGLITSDVLALGDYALTITATDADDNSITASITIHVVDTTNPVWNPMPVDQTIAYGNSLNYNVNADDLSTITYSISDTINFAIDSSTGVITSGVLALGDYALTITATDAEGNYITATITVHVVDTTNPVWNPAPVDQSVELGTTLSYDVNADDSSIITYSISDTTNFAIDSSSGLITSDVLALGDYALTITATDADDNSIMASITIHVVDTKDPVWNPTPVDQTVELGTTLSYDVNAEDLSTITYSISGTTNFVIDSSTGVITSGVLVLGDYALTITATDAEGNYITATITVHVVDTTNPVWNPAPVDQSVELGTTLSYDVNADDSSIITYSISDTTNFAIDSSSGLITSDVLALGDYALTITATDADDNSITASITIHVVDTKDPVWNPTPVDQTVELGTTLSYDVNAEDLSTITYSISGTTNFVIDSSSGLITSGVLALGDYALTITATDAEGNYITATITVHVVDTENPVWDPTPVDQNVELGTTLSYDVNTDDLSTITYSISDTTNFAIDSSSGLITSGVLALGDYALTITATDAEGNYITATITVHVVDTTNPVWDPVPVDQTVELGTTLSYDVNADDLSTITYSISDTTNFAIDSSSGLITSDILALGDYALTITATDADDNFITASITIHVVDTTNPVWNPIPVDQTIAFGNSLSYNVQADDLSTITYSISDTTNFAIDSSIGVITSGALALGDYALTITATDVEGNYITATITVHVVDTSNPVWNPTPVDQTVELGTTLSYDVNADDSSTITYSISDTTNFAIDSNSGLLTSGVLALGDYAITITAIDADDNFITASITIHVVDTTNPVWNPMPVDQTIAFGNSLSYNVFADDLSTITYSISDTTNFAIDSSTGVITSGALALGDYALTITATDAEGNYITATITVHVVDTTDPVWNPTPVDQTVELGTTLSYDVNAEDLSTITYSISDTTNFAIDSSSGLITSGVLALGDYALTITATDADDNSIMASITIHVVDTTNPVWNPAPVDQTVELGTTLSYEVNADDSSTITYSISDTTNFAIDSSSGLITSGALALGDYALTITATDAGDNSITTSITIYVIDTTNPVWDPMPVDQTIAYGNSLNYNVNADDLSTITYSISDIINFTIDSSTGLITSGVLASGDYGLMITATDAGDNSITASITIHIGAPGAPSKVTGLYVRKALYETGIYLEWDANPEPNIDFYKIYREGIVIATTNETSYYDFNETYGVDLTLFTYEVSAVDYYGQEGPKSDIESASEYVPPGTYLRDFIVLILGIGGIVAIFSLVGFVGTRKR